VIPIGQPGEKKFHSRLALTHDFHSQAVAFGDNPCHGKGFLFRLAKDRPRQLVIDRLCQGELTGALPNRRLKNRDFSQWLQQGH
jgi:hypothetical protein